jgi:glycerol uptake facilitator-like aquaporin
VFSVRYIREFLAETPDTFALVLFGDGAVAQVVLGNAARGDTFFGGFLNISFVYGIALMIGICISGGVSGGHFNPAVTLAVAAVKNLKPLQATK